MQRIQSDNFWKCQKNNVKTKSMQKMKSRNKIRTMKMILKLPMTMILTITVSHFSYAPLFQGPHF